MQRKQALAAHGCAQALPLDAIALTAQFNAEPTRTITAVTVAKFRQRVCMRILALKTAAQIGDKAVFWMSWY